MKKLYYYLLIAVTCLCLTGTIQAAEGHRFAGSNECHPLTTNLYTTLGTSCKTLDLPQSNGTRSIEYRIGIWEGALYCDNRQYYTTGCSGEPHYPLWGWNSEGLGSLSCGGLAEKIQSAESCDLSCPTGSTGRNPSTGLCEYPDKCIPVTNEYVGSAFVQQSEMERQSNMCIPVTGGGYCSVYASYAVSSNNGPYLVTYRATGESCDPTQYESNMNEVTWRTDPNVDPNNPNGDKPIKDPNDPNNWVQMPGHDNIPGDIIVSTDNESAIGWINGEAIPTPGYLETMPDGCYILPGGSMICKGDAKPVPDANGTPTHDKTASIKTKPTDGNPEGSTIDYYKPRPETGLPGHGTGPGGPDRPIPEPGSMWVIGGDDCKAPPVCEANDLNCFNARTLWAIRCPDSEANDEHFKSSQAASEKYQAMRDEVIASYGSFSDKVMQTDIFKAINRVIFVPTVNVCPTFGLHLPVINKDYILDSHCDLIEGERHAIMAIFQFFWALTAVMIFIKV